MVAPVIKTIPIKHCNFEAKVRTAGNEQSRDGKGMPDHDGVRPYGVRIAVTVVRYATCSYASSMSFNPTTVVASAFALN